MGKKKKVVPFNQEEIEERIKKDEEEIDRYLAKFSTMFPDKEEEPSLVEEEDTEEFTIDFSKGIVIKKLGEGIVVRTDEDDQTKITLPAQEVKDAAKPYRDLITDILVRKAIAKLLKETMEAHDKLCAMAETLPAHMREEIMKTEKELWDKKKILLNKIIRGNKVWYEEIPDWVEVYVRNYIEEFFHNLTLLAE